MSSVVDKAMSSWLSGFAYEVTTSNPIVANLDFIINY